jgi:hypothetical protein
MAMQMDVYDHLQLIRMHAYDAIDEVKGTNGKSSEIRSCLWSILDNVVHAENMLPGVEHGKSRESGAEGRPRC